DDEWTAQSLLQAADLSHNKGDMEAARHSVEQARQIFAAAHKLNSVVSATGFLAVMARDEGKLDDAARFAEEALVLARKTGNLGAISSSARAFASIRVKQNKLEEARTLIEEAKAADAKTNSVGDRISTLGIAGEILEAKGDNAKALEAYQEAVKLVESVRSTAASEAAFADVNRNYRPYERIVRILIKLNRPEDAFDYLNRAKSKKLQDSLQKAQKRIPPEVMLIQYAPLGEELYVFLVTKTGMKILIAPGKPADLFKKILSVRRQITTGETGAPLTKNLAGLYDTLIAPIEADIAPIKVLAFIPNGLLYYLPMQALAKKSASGEVRYLIEDKQIVYLTAA